MFRISYFEFRVRFLVTAIALCGPAASTASPPVTAAAFAPDGASVVLGSQAGVEVLSWPDLAPVRRLGSGLAHIHDLQFSQVGDRLAVAGGRPGENGEAEVFAWPSGERMTRLAHHDDLIYAVAWRSDGRAVVTASWDQTACVIDLESGAVMKLEGHSRGLLAAAFFPDGETLVTASADQSLRVWNSATGQILRSLDNHTGAVRALAFRPQTADALPMLASAGADRTVRFWQPTIGRMVRFVVLPAEPLSIAWTPDGKRLVASCADGRLRVIDPDTTELVADLAALNGQAFVVALAPDGAAALVAGENGRRQRIPLDSDRR